MSGVVKKYVVVCDGYDLQFNEFADSPEEALKNTGFDLDDTEKFFVIEVSKTWEVQRAPRLAEEDNMLSFLGYNIPQKRKK